MNRKNSAIFALGLAFYGVAELVPLTSAIGAYIFYGDFTPQFISSTPGGWFVYSVQFDKPLLMVFAVFSLVVFFWCFSYMKMDRLYSVLLYSVSTIAVILAIPDWFWNVGSGYYEILKYYSGVLSLIVCFLAVSLYVHWWTVEARR